ncbi:forkhead transcription factor 3 [Kwoniella heveanensis CBS 569]|nr:forkhead transcription factor 3 [Kwoniella heveanensis CBS 569]
MPAISKHSASLGVSHPSPTRTSPRKASNNNNNSAHRLYPTPLSMSPTGSTSLSASTNLSGAGAGTGPLRFPPSFDPHHTSSRYPAHSQNWTPYSPYRPGEYGRSERGLASERTKIERKLFDDDEDRVEDVREKEREGPQDRLMVIDAGSRSKEGSSPLAPAFEAKMVLRNGASIDLISWLRTNFHHLPPPHTVLTPCMPLNGIRHLLLERFPRAPEVQEISKAVLAAFPHSQWDYPTGASCEPPTIRGLVWHGKDIADEDEVEEPIGKPTIRTTNLGNQGRVSNGNANIKGKQPSRSPTQSTLVSPISSSKRQLPDTPARSVLEEFAEIATQADKTPTFKAKSLPGDPLAPSPDQLDRLVDLERSGLLGNGRKRRASQSPELGHRRRASTPDKLHGLLAAAEAVEGSPIGSVLGHGHGHKRRRTIGGTGPARELMGIPRKSRLSRGTLSPPTRGHTFLPQVSEDIDFIVPLNDTASAASVPMDEEDAASTSIPLQRRAPTSSTASQSSIVSHHLPTVSTPGSTSLAAPATLAVAAAASSSASAPTTSTAATNNVGGGGGGRKVNELPTEGDAPGYDCKPPYPYHEMIRHAIENAPDNRLQLSQIYSNIADRFPFFKTLDEKKTAGWQNSIRHNLSLKKMFVRVNKLDGVPDDSGGKGGWWTVQPGVPDEGRPGRKAKAKKAKADAEAGTGTGNVEGNGSLENGQTTEDGYERAGEEYDSHMMNGNDNNHKIRKTSKHSNGSGEANGNPYEYGEYGKMVQQGETGFHEDGAMGADMHVGMGIGGTENGQHAYHGR